MRSTRLKKSSLVLAICGVVLGASLASGGSPTEASTQVPSPAPLEVKVEPALALMGTPFSITISGLKPGEQATLTARTTDKRGRPWQSSAVFATTDGGTVDVGVQAPVSGSYAVADVFGPLWSMKPPEVKGQRPPSFANDEVEGWEVEFSAKDASGRTASATLRRVYQMPGTGLVRLPLEKEGMRGFLYYPAEGGPYPGLLIVGGSNGGLYEWLAQAFASNGFAALTLAYFGYPGLPAELVEIPVEYFNRAAAWMKTQPAVRPGRLGLAGGSKGGELALLLASRYDDFQAVVAWTPGAHVWEGLSQKYFNADYVPISSWSAAGAPLPFVSFKAAPEDKEKEQKGDLNSYIALHHKSLAEADPALLEKAAIPVEKIRAPILLISGTLDQTWPADDFCRMIVARLEKARFPYEVRHVSHKDAGHGSFLPYLITANTAPINGGLDRANAAAGFDSWKETIAFLRKHLGR